MAKITLHGRLGSDAELRYTQSKKAVLSFSVAVNRRIGQQFVPTWWPCKIWGDQAESLQGRLKKGTDVLVEGYIEPREWKNKDGTSQRSIDVIVETVAQVLGKEEKDKYAQDPQPIFKPADGMTEEDVPF